MTDSFISWRLFGSIDFRSGWFWSHQCHLDCTQNNLTDNSQSQYVWRQSNCRRLRHCLSGSRCLSKRDSFQSRVCSDMPWLPPAQDSTSSFAHRAFRSCHWAAPKIVSYDTPLFLRVSYYPLRTPTYWWSHSNRHNAVAGQSECLSRQSDQFSNSPFKLTHCLLFLLCRSLIDSRQTISYQFTSLTRNLRRISSKSRSGLTKLTKSFWSIIMSSKIRTLKLRNT